MKRIFTILAAVFLTATLWAQSPEKMSYQAVIRDASDNLATNQTIGMQISILQGSASGTAVYTETQEPTTNANGLVTIEIGNGSTLDTFANIDWSTDTYFIKTETDPTGGINYTITGVSQLLSVPYALHAKTAETVTGGITESDPVYTTSEAANITASDISNLGNLSGTNSGDQDISGIVTNQQAIQDTASQIRADIPDVSGFVSTESDPVYTTSEAAKITASDITNLGNLSGTNSGDQDITGIATNTQAIQDTASQIRADIPTVATYSVGDFAQGGIVFWVDETGQHGLVCAKEDQDGGSGMRWDAGTYGRTRATGNGLFAGELNTAIIISSQVSIGDDGHDYAAQICNYLQITQNSVIYGDWYLPSKYELNLMWTNESTINATALENSGSSIASAYNWSSTESSSSSAWKQTFGNGFQSYYNKYHTSRVRAVRAF
jgi:hypothetical protein